jgi:hypothetical protein
MKLFSTFHKRTRVVLGCAALLLASPYVAALPLSGAHTSNASAERAVASAPDAGVRGYVELLDLQTQAIDNATVAVEAAREQNTHLVFVLSILVAVLGAVCVWLTMTSLAGHRTIPYQRRNQI